MMATTAMTVEGRPTKRSSVAGGDSCDRFYGWSRRFVGTACDRDARCPYGGPQRRSDNICAVGVVSSVAAFHRDRAEKMAADRQRPGHSLGRYRRRHQRRRIVGGQTLRRKPGILREVARVTQTTKVEVKAVRMSNCGKELMRRAARFLPIPAPPLTPPG